MRPRTASWRAPGRVNLIGDHTDYNDGWVLPFAVPQSVLAVATARDDGVLELTSRQAAGAGSVTLRLDRLAPGSVEGWAAYPAGVAWAMRSAAGLPLAGASVQIDADLPQGAGLASSAALECAVAAALADLAGLTLSRTDLAAIARRAENEFVGMPCGLMDQSAAMFCQAGNAMLLDCRTGEHWPVPLDPAAAGLRLIIIDTGVRHVLLDGGYATRHDECARATRLLGMAALRDVASADEAADRIDDPVLARRARHVISENERVTSVARLLRAGRLAECGPLLTRSHDSLRADFEVSWPAADTAVVAALAAGALGARMTGGGFGGCVLALVPAQRLEAVETAVRSALAAAGGPEPGFMAAEPSRGAHRA